MSMERIGWIIENEVDPKDIIKYLEYQEKVGDSRIPDAILLYQILNSKDYIAIATKTNFISHNCTRDFLRSVYEGDLTVYDDEIDTWHKMKPRNFITKKKSLSEIPEHKSVKRITPNLLEYDENGCPEKRIIKCLNTKDDIELYKDFLRDYPNSAPKLLIIRNESNKEDANFFISYGVEHVAYVNTIKEGLDTIIKFLTDVLSDETTRSTSELYSFQYTVNNMEV